MPRPEAGVRFVYGGSDLFRPSKAFTIRFMSDRDPLTGLPGHAACQATMSRWIAIGRAFALLRLDVDQLKVVNGFDAARRGNWLLREVGQAADALDPQAPAFRVAGDEFVVLLPTHESDEAVRFAQRIRAAVLSIDLSVSGEPTEPGDPAEWRPDCSIGIARWPDDAGTTEALLAAADRALMAAKRSGGGSVVSATDTDG